MFFVGVLPSSRPRTLCQGSDGHEVLRNQPKETVLLQIKIKGNLSRVVSSNLLITVSDQFHSSLRFYVTK